MEDTTARVIRSERRWALDNGEAYAWLRGLPDGCCDLVLTDPPYCSGGVFRADRARNTDDKYTVGGARGRRADFEGDNRDQRSFVAWCALWMAEALRISAPGGLLVTFIDWRNLAAMTDAVQCGGWVLRGIAVWDKTEGARPVVGGLRAQAEFIVWGSRGARGTMEDILEAYPGAPALPGVFRQAVRQDDKHHQTGKPTTLLADLVTLAPVDGLVVDPFAGSFTTGVAALLKGRRVIGCEIVEDYAEIGRARAVATAANASYGHGPNQLGLFATSG